MPTTPLAGHGRAARSRHAGSRVEDRTSGLAAEVGHLELVHRYFVEAAQLDLEDLGHNSKHGLHVGTMAGAQMVVVYGSRRTCLGSEEVRSRGTLPSFRA